MDGEQVVCEICHKDLNPKEWDRLNAEFKDQIYRPGQDVSYLETLTNEEMTERRIEIEALFANPASALVTENEEPSGSE